MKLLTIQDVSVSYGRAPVLSHVWLDVYTDDFLGIIGPNGGGKTTLVKAVMGLVPYSGRIDFAPGFFDGSRAIGYMPQVNDFDRKFPITIRELVLSGLQSRRGFWGRYTRADRRQAAALLDFAGIAGFAGKTPDSLSGGQLQRALLCRAVISEPALLILDEPANFVDNRFEGELYAMLQRLNERMAIIMVSHDVGTIAGVVKDIVCVNRTVHRHEGSDIDPEQLENYGCPIQVVAHGRVPHTVPAPYDR